MKSYENKFHCLAFNHPESDTGKVYHQNFQDYLVDSPNEPWIVFHKKQLKVVDFKDIGSTMGVILLLPRKKSEKIWLSMQAIAFSWRLFSGFDEFTGEQYCYLPHFPLKDIFSLQNTFSRLDFPFTITQTEKGVLFGCEDVLWSQNQFSFPLFQTSVEKLSFLFGLTLLYGKFELKGNELKSIKIHLPLFWQYLQYKDSFNAMIQNLQEDYYFFQVSENMQWDACSYQITSNDWEVLQLFSEWMKQEVVISKNLLYQQVKDLLPQFFDDLAIENKTEICNLLNEREIKILIK